MGGQCCRCSTTSVIPRRSLWTCSDPLQSGARETELRRKCGLRKRDRDMYSRGMTIPPWLTPTTTTLDTGATITATCNKGHVKIVEKENDFKSSRQNILVTFKIMASDVHIKRV